jgi:glucosamine 6-phosphate synthetase-like amidotransferase/phosphosugar isomerase protein
MCNTAAYVGSQPAAPILLDLIEAEEGLWGGHYTGLATIHEGKIYYDKAIGDAAHLRETTAAETFPGTIGIVHSRTPSGGDREWGQPFVDADEALAYLAQGSMGYWAKRTNTALMAGQLAEAGHTFRSSSDISIGAYPRLPDGTWTHTSEVMAHWIAVHLAATGDPEQAIRRAFTDWPGEIMGLYITLTHPDTIYGARWNQPICVGRDNTGTYLAGSPMAFPRDFAWQTWVPPWSVMAVTADSLKITPLCPPDEALPDDIDRGKAREAVLHQLADGEARTAPKLSRAVSALSQRDNRIVSCDPLYQILADLENEGVISHEIARVEGSAEGLTAPQFRFHLTT